METHSIVRITLSHLSLHITNLLLVASIVYLTVESIDNSTQTAQVDDFVTKILASSENLRIIGDLFLINGTLVFSAMVGRVA